MITILTVVSIALAVAALVQLVRAFETSAKLKGDESPLPSDAENRYQSRMMLVFMFSYFAFFLWLYLKYAGEMLPVSGSAHGVELDWLLDFNFIIITIVFVITHIYLFYFAFRYAASRNKKAYYYTHSNKLELLWTTVPALFLAVIIVYGLSAWIDITDDAPAGAHTIELYSKQFDWTARYAGADSTLGAANYNMISGTNALGVISAASVAQMTAELEAELVALNEELATVPNGGLRHDEITETIARRQRQLDRVKSFGAEGGPNLGDADDDVIVKNEFYLPVNKEVKFEFRSRDVIHSAYMPHFRAQMNCVPGMTTQFHFLPTHTTAEMRKITGKDDFDYMLLCNKICGAAHYNMKMTIKVVELEEYNAWLAMQTTFAQSLTPAPAEEPAAAPAPEVATAL